MPLECKSSALPLELIPLVHWFYSPIFSLYPRELQLAMNIIIKKHRNWRIGVSLPFPLECIIERCTTWANPLVYWFYWPIFSLFPRALQLKMNIIIKKQKLENPGIDPGDSRMQIDRSTTWANPPCALILFTNLFIISSWVAISNEYNYKETEIGEFGIDPGDSRIQIDRSTSLIVSIDQSFPYFLVSCN